MNEIYKPDKKPDWTTQWECSTLRKIKNFFYEIFYYAYWFFYSKGEFKLIIFPCGTKKSNPASLLRAYIIGKALRNDYNWRVMIIPPSFSLKQRLRILDKIKPDLILMQMERHPLNRPSFYSQYKVVFDVDDADFLWEHARNIMEECAKGSSAIIAGSQYVADWAAKFNKNVQVIWTGSTANDSKQVKSQLYRRPVVAWGHSRPQDYPHEAKFIEDVLIAVGKRTEVEYWLFGVTDNKVAEKLTRRVLNAGILIKSFSPMSFSLFTKKLESVSIGLQVLSPDNEFSNGKSFGKILNYLSAGVCIVASKGADHSVFFDSGRNGMLASNFDEWVESIVWLLTNPDERVNMALEAKKDFNKHLNIDCISSKYDSVLRKQITQ